MSVHLDWSHAKVGDLEPCVICGKGALMRSPDRGVPCHKTCAEKWITENQQEGGR